MSRQYKITVEGIGDAECTILTKEQVYERLTWTQGMNIDNPMFVKVVLHTDDPATLTVEAVKE